MNAWPRLGDMNEEEGAAAMQQQEARRKRGRPPKRDPKEEDVCFHCHDGGQLILCDRRPCPKVYHLHCTGRDAEFFQTTASWFCSWHYCSLCMKSAVILCYTCTNSYCKNCIKAVSFIPLRKNRGFCETCFELVKMIENGETVNNEGIIVDFNDRETYEFLYKDYWEDTKKDLSLTWEEIYRSMKANEGSKKSVTNSSGNRNWGLKKCDANDKEWDAKRASKWQRHRPSSEYSTSEDDGESGYSTERDSYGKRIRSRRRKVKTYRSCGWASPELLDFIQFMGKNPREPLAAKIVSELLWTYIENNKLQDPEKRGQIVCDERLKRLFGRQSVGQFEIRKLLKHLFASKHENVRKFSNNMAGLEADCVEVSSSDNESFKGKSKSRRKLEKHKSRKVYSNNYAAINVSNINLIYIKRSLLEVLLHDPALSSKIVGSYIRIRSLGMAGTNDTGYAIVQVTGIKHQPDCVNAKHGCFTLEVLTAKQEEATIEVAADLISDRDFTEEECERLRQSMKLGIMPVMMVADLEEKANTLHEVKVTDFIKTELMKLCNLRDRANEKGNRKEVMEYVEKLRLLRSSDERKRRLMEPITVMSDSDMDPTIGFSSQKHTSNNQSPVADTHMDIACIDPKTPVNDTEVAGGLQVLDDENMKIWHYQDPKSRTQGPFSMKQLRKWAKANLFPSDLRIWRAESKDEVILLSNALEKKIKESNPSDAINIL